MPGPDLLHVNAPKVSLENPLTGTTAAGGNSSLITGKFCSYLPGLDEPRPNHGSQPEPLNFCPSRDSDLCARAISLNNRLRAVVKKLDSLLQSMPSEQPTDNLKKHTHKVKAAVPSRLMDLIKDLRPHAPIPTSTSAKNAPANENRATEASQWKELVEIVLSTTIQQIVLEGRFDAKEAEELIKTDLTLFVEDAERFVASRMHNQVRTNMVCYA